MKRPKIPNLRIPKKYRDGKVLAAVMDVLQSRFEAAKEIDSVPARFDALAKLETKVDKHHRYLWRQIYSRQGKQDVAMVAGGLGGGMTVGIVGMIIATPPLLIVAAPLMVIPTLAAIYNPLADSRNKKNETHPLARLQQLAYLCRQINAALTQTAIDHPLELVEKPRFKALCGESADLREALSEAVVKSRHEKPVENRPAAPDLTAALSKPRLSPQPKR